MSERLVRLVKAFGIDACILGCGHCPIMLELEELQRYNARLDNRGATVPIPPPRQTMSATIPDRPASLADDAAGISQFCSKAGMSSQCALNEYALGATPDRYNQNELLAFKTCLLNLIDETDAVG